MTDAPPLRIEDLPLLATPAQVRRVLQLSDWQLRTLIRERRIGHIPVGSRKMIPRESVRQFILDSTVQPSPVETRRSIPQTPRMRPSPELDAAASAERLRRAMDRLREKAKTDRKARRLEETR